MTTSRVSLIVATALAVPLLLAGCSDGDGDEPGGAADETSATPSTSEPATSAPATSTPAGPEFGFDGASPGESASTRVTIGCNGFSDYVFWDQVVVEAPVELTGFTSDGEDIDVGRVWITDDRKQASGSGLTAVEARGTTHTDEPGWPGRKPLAGARMDPGTTYTVFAELAIGDTAAQGGFELSYVVDGQRAVVTWPHVIKRRGRC